MELNSEKMKEVLWRAVDFGLRACGYKMFLVAWCQWRMQVGKFFSKFFLHLAIKNATGGCKPEPKCIIILYRY